MRPAGTVWQSWPQGYCGLNTVCPPVKLTLTFNAHEELLGGEISWGFKRQLRLCHHAGVNPLIGLLDILRVVSYKSQFGEISH